ncbi:MAG: M23 family metallopeptidase, partial [Candidatus Moraniibacteriota bacterium]
MLLACLFVSNAYALVADTLRYPTDSNVYVPGSYSNRHFFAGKDHLGEDVALPEGTPIRAIGNGTIVVYRPSAGYGELAVVIEHDLGREYAFVNAYSETVVTRKILSIYGHVRDRRNRNDAQGLTWRDGQGVKIGEVIGYINNSSHPDGQSFDPNGDGAEHLHMGIRLSGMTSAEQIDPGAWFRGYEKSTDQGKYFASANAVIQTHSAYNPSTEVQARCQGTVCWTPTTSSCEGADTRYRLGNNMFAQPAGMDACVEAQNQLFSIADSQDPQEQVPEDPLWQRFWRAIRNVFGETVSAADIRDFGTINTINVYTGNVVAGNASKAVYGTGQGYPIQSVAPPTLVPPD